MKEWDAGTRIALLTLAVLAAGALLAPLLAPHSPTAIVGARMLPPSPAHLFGTDDIGRDVFSRVLYGGRMSLAVAALATVVAATIGTGVGAIAGFVGGRVDALLMRTVDLLLALPRLLVLIAVFAFWEGLPVWALIALIGATSWFPLSRLVRGQVRSARERDFVAAARALGATESRVLLRHVMPAVTGTILAATPLIVGNVVVLEAGLSFLGVGVQPPTPSWGSIVQDGATVPLAFWIALFPGLAIAATAMAANALGDSLREAIDPRQLPQR